MMDFFAPNASAATSDSAGRDGSFVASPAYGGDSHAVFSQKPASSMIVALTPVQRSESNSRVGPGPLRLRGRILWDHSAGEGNCRAREQHPRSRI